MITYAGNLYGQGITPLTRRFQVSENVYVGQIVMDSYADSGTGHVMVLDQAAQGGEDDHRIIGVVSAVHNTQDTSEGGSGKGALATYDTTQAAQVANSPVGACEVEVIYALPGILFRAPIYVSTHGTALTELVVSSASTDGLTVTHAKSTAINTPDDVTTCYCRTGANRGHYRIVSTTNTDSTVVTIAFPYDTAVGDKFVTVGLKLGLSYVQFDAAACFIDANETYGSNWYPIVVHELNLEKSGQEYAIFSFPTQCTVFGGSAGYLGL